ncbi:hypothetical protein I4641_09435 [Waterburya agarophytonicola K14]|uniref:Uncharacterized protein n=1 Tax=Waterburya agarophytonicola KI4 TaxID=2874699 RepID=A0A964BPH3_9CYAN|nr:hypothetical protein [Waterburya agarophytonicola]MCC0177198.1 hypothetical protein [Waterburya agarophytonicola KI4]
MSINTIDKPTTINTFNPNDLTIKNLPHGGYVIEEYATEDVLELIMSIIKRDC